MSKSPALIAAVLAVAIATVSALGQQQGNVISVPAGANLQDAINGANAGDTIALQPGATFVGNFVLPVKDGNQFITIRTAGDEGLPAANHRVGPADAPQLAKLKSGNSTAVLRTAPGAHHWRVQLLEFQANAGGLGDIILLGDGSRDQNDLSEVPHDLVVDQCYVHGDPTAGQKRGIALNSASTRITNSYISDIKTAGQDTQAIAGWNGPGPFLIENNYLEAAGENVMLGGTDAAIRNLVPSDVTFRRNQFSKPTEWRDAKWTVKNLFELKNARRVLIEDNLFEYNWQSAQPGYAIVITPRNSDGTMPWATVEDVTFRSNVVRHVAAVFNILGEDNARPSGPARRIRIANSLFYDVNQRNWGGNGVFMQIGEGPPDVTVDHNTILHTGAALISAYGGTKDKPRPIVGFTFENNVARHNNYGVFGSGRSYGMDSLNTFFPGAVFTHNVLAGGSASKYPGGNLFPSLDEFERQFEDFKDGDYRLLPTSRWKGAGSDGEDLGASIDALTNVLAGGRGQRPERTLPERGRGRGRVGG
jgi:hypothetical protein